MSYCIFNQLRYLEDGIQNNTTSKMLYGIVMVEPKTHEASGILKEVKMANTAGKKYFK